MHYLFLDSTLGLTVGLLDSSFAWVELKNLESKKPSEIIHAEIFNLLKKFIDTKVILLEPFVTQFIFWKSDNPAYSYSFSSPNKNKIILDLISFINTAQKPVLDDFFEQNNLKHKQGYLQTLLDSAEAAGIFRFKREGNEIVILRGPNYKAFLEGKVRRVM